MKLAISSALAIASLLGSNAAARSAILFRDDFDGRNTVSSTFWQLPQLPIPAPGPGEPNPTFLGRTQLRLDQLPTVVDGIARLELNTFNPRNNSLQPGEIPSLLGSEVITQQTFSRGKGLAVEARVRVNAPTLIGTEIQRGLLASLFLFASEPIGSNQFLFNEIDFEFLTNAISQAAQGAIPTVLTNVFANEPPGVGNPSFVGVENLDLTDFNTFRIEWLPNEVRWLVNDNLVFSNSVIVPDKPMKLHLNFWAPTNNFTAAFDSSLQPAFSAETNQTFFYEVDFVQVEQLAQSIPETNSVLALACVAGVLWLCAKR